MVKDIKRLLQENEQLTHEKDELHKQLKEAKEVIEAIQHGNIDAVFTADNETANVLSKTADQTYRRFIENMSEGVVSLHTNGVIVYSNSSFSRMVALPLEKVVGKNFHDFIPIEYKDNFEVFFNEYPTSAPKFEMSIVNQMGIQTHFSVSLKKLQLQDFVSLNLVITDVTDQKKAEENLLNANKNLGIAIEERIFSEKKIIQLNMKLVENINILQNANTELATFAHIASHDLQEPLRKITTYSTLLIRDYSHIINLKGQNYLSNMENASKRMRNLINDILQYSELSQKDFIFKETNLQLIVEEIVSNLEIVIRETKAQITIKKKLPVIEANSAQMRQLFQNFISNSLKFKKENISPEIRISYKIVKGKDILKVAESRLHEDFCLLSISDNGIGFDPKYKDKIFAIFQRLHSTSAYQGTGIGLAICKKIVDHHHGFIEADSTINNGSLFRIMLPVRQSTTQKDDETITT